MLGMIGIGQWFGTAHGRVARIDPARADGIDANFRAKADGERVSQGQQTALARRIRLGIRLRLRGTGRGQIDDRPVVSAKIRRTVLGQ
ncbi:hypothetical protein D3C85_1278740 [compost metagenome]